MRILARVLAISIASLFVSATAEPLFLPLGKYDEGVMIPADSELKFGKFDTYDSAHFIGRIVVEGVFVIECWDCEPGIEGHRLKMSIVPDPQIAARLPRWKKHDNDIVIGLVGAEPLIRAFVSPDQRKLLLSGRLDEIRGRTAIIVDRYTASLDCDSADYSARFVAIAKATKLADTRTNGNYGCGFH